MERRSKWLWVLTVANVALVFCLFLVLYAIVLALAVIAPEISEWPLYVIVPLGMALSIISLRFTRSVGSHIWRYMSYSVNGGALALHLLIICGFAALFISSTKERFLIPEGYKGDVYVVYGAPDGEAPNRNHWEVTYRIPKDGVLRVQGPLVGDWTRTEYDYQTDAGKLERISNFWPTTVHPTAENLSNDRDIGVFFPRTGKITNSTGCSVQFQMFYVGTKAHLLTKYKELNIDSYLEQHPVACEFQPK